MNYGLPYMGSKNLIANKIINFLPQATNFYDLFGGGGAIAHCALLSTKYQNIYYNELNKISFLGFEKCVCHAFKTENRWISRNDFEALKSTDPYVAFCYSFGNNLRTYCYNPDVEPIKKAIHYAICFGDYSLLDMYLNKSSIRLNSTDIHSRRIELQNYLHRLYFTSLNELDSDFVRLFASSMKESHIVQHLERLDRINELNLNGIITSNLSYNEVQIKSNSIIYCDIPYKDKAKYNSEFDYDTFYSWALKQENIFISEYNMPDDFICVSEIPKQSSFSKGSRNKFVNERIYIPKKNYIEDLW